MFLRKDWFTRKQHSDKFRKFNVEFFQPENICICVSEITSYSLKTAVLKNFVA